MGGPSILEKKWGDLYLLGGPKKLASILGGPVPRICKKYFSVSVYNLFRVFLFRLEMKIKEVPSMDLMAG